MKIKSLVAIALGAVVFTNVLEPVIESLGQLAQTWFASKANEIQIQIQKSNKDLEIELENILNVNRFKQ